MKLLYYLSILILVQSCQNKSSRGKQSHINSNTTKYAAHDIDIIEPVYENFTGYLVISDTGLDYLSLKEKAVKISQKLHLPIDSFPPQFNSISHKVDMPEIWDNNVARKYIHSRYYGKYTRVENLSFYTSDPENATMAVIAGIYGNKNSADSFKSILSAAGFPSHIKNVSLSIECAPKKETVNSNNSQSEDPTPDDFSELDQHATRYIVISDSGINYSTLSLKMHRISKATGINIDTMGRYFDNAKQMLILPEDDEDEIYAGDYFMRRYGDDVLSIEYLSVYKDDTNLKTMAVVAGIFETRARADSISTVLYNSGFQSQILTSKLYMGCMH